MRFACVLVCLAHILLPRVISAGTDNVPGFTYDSYVDNLPRGLNIKRFSFVYYYEDTVARYVEAGERYGLSKERIAEIVERETERMQRNKDALDALVPDEKAVIESIWGNMLEAKIAGDLLFGVSSAEGDKQAVVTVLHISPSRVQKSESLPPADVIISDISKLTNLTHLNLAFQNISSSSFERLRSLHQLKYLAAPENVTDEMLSGLLEAVPTIEYLDLTWCEHITGGFAKHRRVAAHLREVHMVGTALDIDGLIRLMMLPDIRMISVDGANVYVDGSITLGVPRGVSSSPSANGVTAPEGKMNDRW